MMPVWFLRKLNSARLKDDSYKYLLDEESCGEFVAFDTETTGLNPRTAEILSIGAVRIRGNRVLTSERFEAFLKPQNEIGIESIKVHHIREMDVEHALTPKEAIDEFLKFIGSCALVGYYLEFDVAMINKYLKKFAGISLINRQIEISALYFDATIDVFGSKNVDLRFDAIAENLQVPIFGKHSALQDAIMTALIYLKLQKNL